MRVLNFAFAAAFTFQLAFSPVGHASEAFPKSVDTKAPYPAAVSLRQEPTGWTFRQSRTNLQLYYNDKDSPAISVCDAECEEEWVPLLVKVPDEKSLGQWTVFEREDGQRQWAFENHPIYLHAERLPTPIRDDKKGVWHLMPHFPAAAK